MNKSFYWQHGVTASVLSILFVGFAPLCIHAQDTENPSRRHPPGKKMAPKAYTFAMTLSPGTDCFVRTNLMKKDKNDVSNDLDSPLVYGKQIERMFRKDISCSKEILPDGTEETYYFVGGMCAYDTAAEGVNVLRYLEGHTSSNIASYHFPELAWAFPETRQVDPIPKDGQPKIHLYMDENFVLEVDADSNLPKRFSDGFMEWVYSYKPSSNPIILPEKLQKAVDRVFNTRSRKP